MSRNDQQHIRDPTSSGPSSTSFASPATNPSHHIPRQHRSSRSGRLRRHQYTQPQSAYPIQSVLSSAGPARGESEFPQPVASPPFRDGPSPATEVALLPGGGVQIPPGFRFDETDRGHYRSESQHGQNGEPPQPRVLGGIGFGMFKGLKKIPAAIVKAGRSYGPRTQGGPPVSQLPHPPPEAEPEDEQTSREIPIQDDVETYLEPEDEEGPVREEQLLREYMRRQRIGRDRAYRHHRRRQIDPRYVPSPRPVPVPGARTPAASATASQVGHSQAGHPNIDPTALEAQLEAEEQEQERETLAHAQERERARKVYAADAVKPPPSSVSSDPRFMPPTSVTSYNRTTSEPALGHRVFSRWSAERDVAGQRLENHRSPSSPLSSIIRLYEQIRDMPWVGDRVAADYIPGGVKPEPSSSGYYTSSPGSDSTLSSPYMRSPVDGAPLTVNGVNATSMARSKHGQSWYNREDFLVLPVGVAPPPGFIPYPFPVSQHARSVVAENGEGGPSASSHTHMDAPPPGPAHSTASGPVYVNREAYHYMPAEASATGKPYVFLPMRDGQHQPLLVPETGQQPAYINSHPGQPNFVPATR